MEQLPPKVPIMKHNWVMPLTSAAAAGQQNFWVDEFFDFSATRRSAHRRTVSDPIAYVEASFSEQSHNPNENFMESCNKNNGFERLDDDQLRHMFSDNAAMEVGSATRSSSNSSDQNSDNDDKKTLLERHRLRPKNEPEEVDSLGKPLTETLPPATASSPFDNGSGDAIIDPKRIKRILANRKSAQRSRVRKLQYISELERSVTTLQSEVSALSPRVAFLDHQRLLLNVDNSALKQRIAALAQDNIFKDGKVFDFRHTLHLHHP
ncbi:basic leucine zipper 61-like [Olea europaea subsp. europaea]|uniref:Basic leucine zipper 61-like n=1 Tax=Olea europaea subsp. europaea TaxID=158383 RepID=A0A8S0PLN9_OLEEU|nr:basic leucine zipper 61-like [Olea europaea subsp. europaea]